MTTADVIQTLEDLARDLEQVLDMNQTQALMIAAAIIHSLPATSIRLVDVVFDQSYPTPSI